MGTRWSACSLLGGQGQQASTEMMLHPPHHSFCPCHAQGWAKPGSQTHTGRIKTQRSKSWKRVKWGWRRGPCAQQNQKSLCRGGPN